MAGKQEGEEKRARGQGRKAGRDVRKDGQPDGRPGEGAAIEPARPSARAPGGRGCGRAGEGRGRRYRDNNPAARLRGWRRGGGGGLARPRLSQRPGGIFAPAGQVRLPSDIGARGSPGVPGSRLTPPALPRPTRVELVFRVPLDRAGSCCSPRQEVSFAR